MQSADFLAAAKAAICDRPKSYGPPEDSGTYIANLWNAYLENRADKPLEIHDVFAMLGLMKVARAQHDPQHADSWIDGVGYLALAGETARCRLAVSMAKTEPAE